MQYLTPRYLFRRYELMRRIRTGERFLEIGPGNLALAQELLSRFDTGTLLDFNAAIVPVHDALASSRKQRLTLVVDDFMDCRSLSPGFDCVVACEVLEHVEDDRGFLRKVHELLAASGQLVLSVPARQKYWSFDDEIVGHYRRYERGALTHMLAELGYLQIDIVSYGFPFQNIIRLARIMLAALQYGKKAKWDMRKRSEQSAFPVSSTSAIRWTSLAMNKYSFYPLCLVASCFNGLDLGEGYVITALKGPHVVHAG